MPEDRQMVAAAAAQLRSSLLASSLRSPQTEVTADVHCKASPASDLWEHPQRAIDVRLAPGPPGASMPGG